MRMPYGRKPRQTFLGLVFLGFALVIEAHGTLVDSISLHSVSPPKPCGVVYIAEQGGGKGQGSEIRVKQHGSSDRGAAQFQTPYWPFRVLASGSFHSKNKNFIKLKIWKSFHLISAESAEILTLTITWVYLMKPSYYRLQVHGKVGWNLAPLNLNIKK